ncbi:UDP-N-acetylmuramoyl-tripeptide--D-alanyl-D-alanine ligase [Marinilongibacter aquaticus]|uniref:UDP-N-acetylmuramoyl-tripeptide--D-alanyl-D- alanine ligase n=1 Tax=Marinilongibacter aquaticus TaxID=2975157 RepID=UPI0021BD2AC5|nr:UDP-N-acetylmuramoyl-tripeptide--D-alanyl-D-alanine ligase [Marinilongibacter aquaticus]UBM57757.1 UDP-N-acetylmuramoyl-tripeptide--D-alanyl-D-alanine ligase [Marinilongibacter aquaticus]
MSIEELYTLFLKSSGVCTDTRKIEKDCLFFALKGGNFNGNAFAKEALAKGALYAVIDEKEYKGADCLLVEDVLETLQELANYHRKQFDIPVFALTGSNGKTTNKELLKAVLSKKYKVHATQGNLNNHIGVPLTLLSMPKETEMAIVEMGANHQREIAMLCAIAEPTHGLITNIGKAHLEGFGGEAGIEKGKGELYDYLKNAQAYAFVNETDPKLMEMVKARQMILVVYYGKPGLQMLSASPQVVFKISEEGESVSSHLSGEYNFKNIENAVAVGQYFNVPDESIAEAISAYNPDNNRSQKVEKGSNVVYLDAYNANPSSMEAALRNFIQLETEGPKMVILGDMFELGEYSQAEHEKVGALVAQGKFDLVVLYGENMKAALEHLPLAYYFTDKFSLHNWIHDLKLENYTVLIKGSRGVALETAVKFI